MTILSEADVRNEVSRKVLNEALDDDRDGVADAAVIAWLIESIDEQVLTFMPEGFAVPDSKVPLLRAAAKLFCKAIVYGRHPEYVRNLGMMNKKDSFYSEGKRVMLDLRESVRALRAPATVAEIPNYAAQPDASSEPLRDPDPWELGGSRGGRGRRDDW